MHPFELQRPVDPRTRGSALITAADPSEYVGERGRAQVTRLLNASAMHGAAHERAGAPPDHKYPKLTRSATSER